MVQFWLDNPTFLISTDNFKFNNPNQTEKNIQMLNIVALVSLIVGLFLVFKKKNAKYFGIAIVIMAFTILLKSNLSSSFANVNKTEDVAFDTGATLVKNVSPNDSTGLNNQIYISDAFNFNKGDVIALANNNSILEINIISDIKYTIDKQIPVLVLLKPIKGSYSKYTTKILKVSDTSPDIVPPPDGNISIQGANNNGSSDPMVMATQGYPKFKLPNQNRFDWNLEQSSMVPGSGDTYPYQGQPNGPLKCRESTVNNPMGTINVTEYDAPPTMYGTCNVAEMKNGKYNDQIMTENQEATVSQRVDDLLFHKGNSQAMFSPVPIDTNPDNSIAFANFCYNSPTNLVNAKYASIFVNDPEKFKLVSKLAKATGTENGGGGGGGGRP